MIITNSLSGGVVKLALAALASVGLALLAAPAAANMAAPPRPAEVSGLGTAGARGPLVVRAADLLIDCSNGADHCRLEVTYQLHNPSDATAGGTAAFYAIDTDDVAITVERQPAGRPLTGDDIAAFDLAVGALAGGDPPEPYRPSGDVSRHGFDLSLAAGASAEVSVSGRIEPTSRRRYYMAIPAAPARHRLLVLGGRTDRRVQLEYLVAPIRTWGAFPAEMTFTLKHPSSWTATIGGATGLDASPSGGVTTHRGRIATTEPLLDIVLEASRRTPIHAGLLLGIGGHVDDADGARVRLGLGAGRGAYLASVAVELERGLDSGEVIVPAFQVASPWIIIVPSIGLGLGVPIRVRPTVEVGGRFIADAHVGPVGLMMAIDYYPGMDDDRRRFAVSLLGQLAL